MNAIQRKFCAALWLCLGILSGCGGGSGDASGLVTPVESNATLTVNRVGSGTITADTGALSCPGDCDETYAAGTAVALTATAASGSSFSGWSGSGVSCGSSTNCALNLTDSLSVTATFSPVTATQRQLAVTVGGSGSVSSAPAGLACQSGTCNASFGDGTMVTLTAVPASGYSFSGWSGAGCSGSASTCAVTLSADRSVTATFAAIPNQVLSVSVNGSGAVGSSPAGINNCSSSCTASYAQGASVTLAASPASGYRFTGWGGACSGTGACALTMSTARSVTASFTLVPVNSYALNVVLNGSGSVSSSPAGINCGTSCSATYTSGTAVTLTATPASGYSFSNWSGACTGTVRAP